MPTLSTPASPSPLTEDGDHLMVELREFLVSVSQPAPRSRPYRHAQTAIRLLRHLPVSKDAVLEYFSGLIDASLVHALDPGRGSSDLEELTTSIGDLKSLLIELLRTNGPAWAPFISQWTLGLLGELSSKHALLISKSYSRDSIGTQGSAETPGIMESLPIWLNTDVGRMLADLTVDCISTLRQQDDSQTEKCVSALLEASVRHGPHFDWVVAHVGGCFPDTVITRVLAVGLKDFVAYGATQKAQIAKEGSVNLSKIPKLNSVVGILGHLGGSHQKVVCQSIAEMVRVSLKDEDDGEEEGAISEESRDLHVGTIPFFLHLSSLSDLISSALFKDILQFMDIDVALQIENFVQEWNDIYFPGNGALLNMVVNMVKGCGGLNGRDIWQLLFEFSGETSDRRNTAARQVISGCRQIMEHLFADLLEIVHQSKPGDKIVPILKACYENYSFFVENYFLSKDAFRRKSMLALAQLEVISFGRPTAIGTLNYGLQNATNSEDIATVLLFIRDVELWTPGLVEETLKQSFRSSNKKMDKLLDNLGKILHFQAEAVKELQTGSPNLQDQFKIASKFSRALENHTKDLLPFLARANLIPKVLKILHFLQFPTSEISVSLLHCASQSIVFTIFTILEERSSKFDDEKQVLTSIQQCTFMLSKIVAKPAGLNVVLRFLVEGAIGTPFAKLFGGKYSSSQKTRKTKQLFEENLKFGSMPTQPLGTSTVFHAGIIGEGKRALPSEVTLPKEDVDTNSLILVSILFKLCHGSDRPKDSQPPRQVEIERREQSKEYCKQLALLLVDLVSPDVMYNGLPWPDEEFTRVTVERDLKISNTMSDHPILWKILWGLAEARPALCYCSVILRGTLAVQMCHWQSSLSPTASESPVQLETTRKVLQLMSIGQFIPPPLDGVSEIISILHPFHLHCILIDIWNYVRDNVPSPAPFTTNPSGALQRDFDAYKNYKQYCERLRLILMKHVSKVPKEFGRFFVENALKEEKMMLTQIP